ncbi:MAG: hypothetical protein ACI9H8_000855 [Lysobacterales bacterium]|jgi:hypothetical protein
MDQYLRRYAEPEISALEILPVDIPWSDVLVIPACNESPEFLRPPPPSDGRSLTILVINESGSASAEVSRTNQDLAHTIAHQFELRWNSESRFPDFGMCLFKDRQAPRDILLVDRFNKDRKLPAKGGVGLARKIGADLAASLIHKESIRSQWIHCSDADVHLPETYFAFSKSIENKSAYSALVYPYHHLGQANDAEAETVALATGMYEASLRYYVQGMKFAGSPYAFHTIGSTMVVNTHHYKKVRGFPKREAGEDFYLLNKLAKVGQVLEPDSSGQCQPIIIAARRSDRVPFGTGAAVNKITALENPTGDFLFYHPEVFHLLKLWLQALPLFWELKTTDLCHGLPPEQPALHSGLSAIGTPKALAHALKQSKDLDQFLKQMHTWFDAFRTLKLIHYLRDDYLSSIPHHELLKKQDFQNLSRNTPRKIR